MAIDSGQFLERYRSLSRTLQNSLQELGRRTSKLEPSKQSQAILAELESACIAFQDFNGWVLISTLSDIDDARKNCSPGTISIISKLNRAKEKHKRNLNNKKLKLKIENFEDRKLCTYIQYFEQLLDLILENSIKYSPASSQINIDVSSDKVTGFLYIEISSLGPFVGEDEVSMLGNKNFRSKNAILASSCGEGFGLFNAKKIADLISGKIHFTAGEIILTSINKIPYANFTVKLSIPDVST